MNDTLIYKYVGKRREIYPAHKYVCNYVFKEEKEEEAEFVHFAAQLAEKNGIKEGEFKKRLPSLLRLLRNKEGYEEKDIEERIRQIICNSHNIINLVENITKYVISLIKEPTLKAKK
jgi:molybdopterin converting factor small subunit